MAVWTIAAQAGTGGDRVATALAEAAGVPLLDRSALVLLARRSDPRSRLVTISRSASAAGSTCSR